MLLGIDVGGTSTDGVLIRNGNLEKEVKRPSRKEALMETILEVLDELLEGGDPGAAQRLVISTTLVTNLLATRSGARTALLLLPGRGLPHSFHRIAPDSYILQGDVDFRGTITEELSEEQAVAVIKDIRKKEICHIAVATKFSHRNRSLEQSIAALIRRHHPDAAVTLGSDMADRLNFPRRAATAYYSAMTAPQWHDFAGQAAAAVKRRGLKTPVEILKADGGTMPLAVSQQRPLETAYSGPAASTMGAMALGVQKENAVMIDLGGTTVDIALFIEGEPLRASKGASIEGHLTHIPALALRSMALGGDCALKIVDGDIEIGAREGPAACFGGNAATVTDAFNLYRDLEIGDAARSSKKITALAATARMEPQKLAGTVVEGVLERLQLLIEGMFRQWEEEPAYKVWEVVHRRKFRLDRLLGVGAAAGMVVPLLAEKMGVDCTVHRIAPVANALGAAVARPTLAVHLYADTQRKRYTIDQEGLEGAIEKPASFQLAEAEALALRCLARLAEEKGAAAYAREARIDLAEQFNMIRGWSRVGKIFQVRAQIAPGLIDEFKGVSG
ncbi:MAG TPA: hydantoinase/oxoprolinase family protein [Firmicutes bacterium]|jgi:N-methylhydantoinase A|nr:hydantoinase/oxoprolinase family protein [Bacillota bacterium]